MTSFVLDASVAAKWYLPATGEPLVEEARALGKEFTANRLALFVPDLFWVEIGNILWKAVRQSRMSTTGAQDSLTSVADLALTTVPSRPLIPKALEIGCMYQRTVYDGVYVAAALTLNVPLITAD